MSKRKSRKQKLQYFKRFKPSYLAALTLIVLTASGGLAYLLSGKAGLALLQSSPFLPAGSPSKEYIYAGGKLVATEQRIGANLSTPSPGNLVASATGSSSINLTWVDNNTDETGFKLERTAGSPESYMEVASLPADTTSFTDAGLTGSTTYFYRVKAYNSTSETSYSNEAQARTSPDNILLADDFNDNSLDTAKWNGGIPEINQQLELTSAGGLISSKNTYGFSDSYCSIQLVQPGGTATLTVIKDSLDFYRIRVVGSTMYCDKAIRSNPITIATASLPGPASYIRIRHSSNNHGQVVFERALNNAGVPFKWIPVYSEVWNTTAVPLTAARFEVGGSTSTTLIMDNFRAVKPGVGNSGSPTISNASAANVTTTTATITWTTNLLADSQVEYGPTTAYGSSTPVSDTAPFVTSHLVSLTNLQPGVVYHCRVKSTAQGGTLAVSDDFTFTTPPLPDAVLLADDFNNYSLDAAKWAANNLFSGVTNVNVPVNETNELLEVGPLLQNTAGWHFNGIRSLNAYDFTGAYCYTRLVQPPDVAAGVSAVLTIGADANNYYSLYVSGGSLVCERRVGGVTATLSSAAFDYINHRYLRIRHYLAAGQVVFEVASENAGSPGGWAQLYSEAWNGAAVPLAAVRFELKAGTLSAQANPGSVSFDDFKVARPTN